MKTIRIVALCLCILLLALLTPSPSLMENAAADPLPPLDPALAVPIPLAAGKGYAARPENYRTGRAYADPTLRVTIETDRYLDTDIWIARVQCADPSQLRTALAGPYGGKGTARPDVMARRANAVLAINGDFYSYGGWGVVLRQGRLYRMRPDGHSDILLIDDAGDFHVALKADEQAFLAVYDALGGAAEQGGSVVNVLTFGPALVVEGELAHDVFVRHDGGARPPAQRMVIAQDGPLSYLCVCSEGPESKNSVGLTLAQMADYVHALGCTTAYNLDGGSSSAMVFGEAKINAASTGKVRSVADIVYFSTALLDK